MSATALPLGWSAPMLFGAILAALTSGGLLGRLISGERTPAKPLGRPLSASERSSMFAAARNHPGYLAGITAIFAAINAPAIFIGPRVAALDGSPLDVALAAAAGSVVEIPVFLALPALLERFGGRRVFLAGTLLLGASSLLAALAPSPAAITLARLGFGAGYAAFVIPSYAALVAAARGVSPAVMSGLYNAAGSAGTLLVAAVGLPLALAGYSDPATPLAVISILSPVGGFLAVRAHPAGRMSALPVAELERAVGPAGAVTTTS